MFTKWWTVHSSKLKPAGRALALAALCGVVFFAAGCSLLPKEMEEEALPTINPPKLSKKPEYVVETTTLETKVTGTGRLLSEQEEELFFALENRRLKDVYVQPGEPVTAGQLIAELDVSDLENQLRRKEIESRKDELAMIELLRDATEMTAEQIEQAKLDFEMKRQEVAELRESIEKAKLLAPFDGTLISFHAKKGDLIQAYSTVGIVADLEKLTVAASFQPRDLENVVVGMEAVVNINNAGQFTGKVRRLPIPQEESGGGFPQTRDSIDNYLLVDLDDMPDGLVRGTGLSVSVIIDRKENAVVIPRAALRQISGRNYVQVVDDEGNKREVDIEIGQTTGTQVEVLEGLSPGQKVVGR